jgi:hypothetical protein
MEPGGSLPRSQQPATSPYPDPVKSNPRPLSHFLKIPFNIFLDLLIRSINSNFYLFIYNYINCMPMYRPAYEIFYLQ